MCACLTGADKLKQSLLGETKQWRVQFGKACNQKYYTAMQSIFTFCEDLMKRLTRPIKDLDDIRIAMAALKEIRENEIRIDMTIGPIEVRFVSFPCGLYFLLHHDMSFHSTNPRTMNLRKTYSPLISCSNILRSRTRC